MKKNQVAVLKKNETAIQGEYLGKGAAVATGAGLSLFSASTFAAVPASVTTAIGDAVADVGTVGGLVIGVVVIVFAFAMMRKPMNA